MKYTLALSGGGAIGSWQFEMVKLLLKEGLRPEDVVCITGTSTGALTGLLLSRGLINIGTETYKVVGKTNGLPITKPRTMKLTDNGLEPNGRAITNTIKKDINFLHLLFNKQKLEQELFRNVLDLAPLMDNSPLVETLLQILDIEPIWNIPFYFYAVSLDSGELIEFNESDFNSKLEYAKALASSTTVPLLWSPIPEIKTKTRTYYNVVDGGLREGFPISGAIKRMPKDVDCHLIGLSCNKSKLKPVKITNQLQIAARTAEIMMNEALVNDRSELDLRNEIAWRYGEEINNRLIPNTIIEYSGLRGSMSFSEQAFEDMRLSAIQDIKAFSV